MKHLQFIMSTAHTWMRTSNYTMDWATCLSMAWEEYKSIQNFKKILIQYLREGAVSFFYFTRNGENRPALGTLNQSMFTYEYKGGKVSKNPFIVRYWDFERKGYRSFDIRRFNYGVEILTNVSIEAA